MKTVQRSNKHDKILETATILFGRTHDVKKVSLEAIAQEAGVSPTTIYNYFDTRENLVREVARRLVQGIMEKSRSVLNSDLTFPQKLTELFSAKMDLLDSNGELLKKVLTQDNFKLAEELDFSEIRALSVEFFESGKKQGYIDSSLSNQVLLEYFEVLRAGIAAKPELAARLSANGPLVNELTRLVLYGTLKKDIDLSQSGRE